MGSHDRPLQHHLLSQFNEPVNTKTQINKMKFTIAASLIASAAAFAPASVSKSSSSLSAFSKESLPGAIAPTGLFDPLGFLEKADDATALRYREAEVTHGRVSMLAVIGFFVGEKVEGSSFLFDSQISGPAITHFFQVPDFFWTLLVGFIGALELNRAQLAFVPPPELGPDEAGKMRADHSPGDIGFDPLGLKPEDSEEFDIMATKELQHGRLAMLAAAGFLAREAVDGKGILEHLGF